MSSTSILQAIKKMEDDVLAKEAELQQALDLISTLKDEIAQEEKIRTATALSLSRNIVVLNNTESSLSACRKLLAQIQCLTGSARGLLPNAVEALVAQRDTLQSALGAMSAQVTLAQSRHIAPCPLSYDSASDVPCTCDSWADRVRRLQANVAGSTEKHLDRAITGAFETPNDKEPQ